LYQENNIINKTFIKLKKKTMKNTFKLFVTLFLLAVTLSSSFAQNPTFDYTVKNIKTTYNGPETGDTLTFEVWLKWTNFGASDRFEFAAAQYTWLCNRAIIGSANPGLKLELQTQFAGCPLPAAYRPPTFQVDSLTAPPGQLYLKGSGNNPNSALPPFIVSASGPFGSKILTFRLINQGGADFPLVPLNLQFKLGSAPNTFVAYFLPVTVPDTETAPPQLAVALMDTVANHYVVEDGGFVLPVELASFTSNVNKNNVSLAWTTSTETNNQGFDIERSLVGSNEWTKAGSVAGNGTTTSPIDYSFNDRVSGTGNYNYRLKQIDFNGSVNYHNLSGEVIIGLPSVYAISQNYPNPFNPSTKIDFELPYDSKVSILLYDISGREVGKLVNEQLTAGYHNVQFNGSNLASGMYFYRINANGGSQNFISTKKMVLIK